MLPTLRLAHHLKTHGSRAVPRKFQTNKPETIIWGGPKIGVPLFIIHFRLGFVTYKPFIFGVLPFMETSNRFIFGGMSRHLR